MQGTYVIKQDGVEIARSSNLITLEGKKIMAAYMAGIAPSWAGAIAIGAGGATAVNTDTMLDMEFGRSSVTGKSVIYDGGGTGIHRLVAKTTIPSNIAGKIYELGVFSIPVATASTSPSMVIAGIFPSDDWEKWSGTAWNNIGDGFDTTTFRTGADAPNLVSTGGLDKFRLNLGTADYSMYSGVDKFSFGSFYPVTAPSVIAIKFYSDDSNYFTYSPSVASMIGAAVNTYTTLHVAKSSWTAVGTPSWNNITSIGVDITGGGICLDAIRVDDADSIDPNYALVSRSVLITPVLKSSGSEMDIEYYLDI